MSHNNYTHNSNNNYDVSIVIDPNATQGTGTTAKYDDNGEIYYEISIIPKQLPSPLFAANFRIGNNSGSYILPTYKWDYSYNPNGTGNGNPPPPPHNINTQQNIYKILLGQYGPLYPTDNTPIYGPIKFEQTTIWANHVNLNVTWSKIILKEIYQDDSGNLHTVNGQLEFQTSEESQWNASVLNPNNFTTNNYPVEIKAYVYIDYRPGYSPNQNESFTIDFDEVEPIEGCTDPTALNTTPGATIDDGSCTYAPPPPPPPPPPVFTLPPFTMGHTVGQALVDVNYPNSPTDMRVLVNLSIDIQAALYIPFPNLPVTYDITELYYIDNNGNQVDIQRTTNLSIQSPPYGLSPIAPGNLVHYFSLPSNIITYPTPTNVTLSVPPSILAGTMYINGVLLPTDLTNSFTTDVHCTIVATNSAFTSSHTEIITV